MGETVAASVAASRVQFVNSLGMKFVPVVTSSDGKASVLFSVWETRVRDYAAYAAAKPGVDDLWNDPVFEGQPVTPGSDYPVVGVSWEDAQGFCAWLTAKERGEGKIGSEQTYRLPTDAEWSWAVGIGEAEERAGKGRSPQEKNEKIGAGRHPWAYPWGEDWTLAKGVGNYADTHAKRKFWSLSIIAFYDDGYATTSPVGSYGANAQGLYDLGGNVCEWVEDFYDGKNGLRSLRGGSWVGHDPRNLLSSFRSVTGAENRGDHYSGFRLVLAGAVVR
jgi:formylglycine-generating enzyme required for sulfatase activity